MPGAAGIHTRPTHERGDQVLVAFFRVAERSERRDPPVYFQAHERPALFQLAHVRPIYPGLICQVLLGQTFGVPKTA
jgi:hypothetical protein